MATSNSRSMCGSSSERPQAAGRVLPKGEHIDEAIIKMDQLRALLMAAVTDQVLDELSPQTIKKLLWLGISLAEEALTSINDLDKRSERRAAIAESGNDTH